MTIKTKFEIGQQVYVYTKQGLVLQTIKEIKLFIEERCVTEAYYFGNSPYDGYSVEQIIADNKQKALSHVRSNMIDLQLKLVLSDGN